eukprot:TRINITY_DN9052_c1_g1_i3.p1 TRINITY_DN9052_c1_g1~~TRINITY_DN9052_c1_g1_i3.p1  ORF type:complete len:311 (-),score=58.37 TRINITY_DN9052_c1_g1_i3:1165-2097(-)
MLSDFESEGFKVQQNEAEGSGTGFSFWSVGSLVTKGAKQFVQNVQQTDWQKQISSLTSGEKQGGDQVENKGLQVKEKLDQLSLMGKSFLQGTKEIWEQVTEAIETDIQEAANEVKRANRPVPAVSQTKQPTIAKKHNKLDSSVSTMQRQSSTYIEELPDVEAFAKFKSGFQLDEKKQEIDGLLAINSFMSTLHQRLVPQIVDDYTFWSRYFYQLHLLEQKHSRAEEERQVLQTVQGNSKTEVEQQIQQPQEKIGEDAVLVQTESVAQKHSPRNKNSPQNEGTEQNSDDSAQEAVTPPKDETDKSGDYLMV